MRFILAVFVLFAVHIAVAHADCMDYHFRVNCDSLNNRAEIVPYAIWNKDVYSAAPQDCSLANGRTIRAKMGLGPTYPYGMGGAIPSKWLSVWVDKAQVLSRAHFDCDDEGGPCGLRIVVTANGLETCRRGSSGELFQPDSLKKPEENCEFIPNEKLSTVRDALEFPSPNERLRPPVGSLVTLFAKDQQFCSQFQLLQPYGRPTDNISPRVGLPDNAETIKTDAFFPYKYSGHYQQYTFDINNDGKKDTVIGLHSRTHYRDGDIYFVYTGNTVPNSAAETVGSTCSELVYAKSAARILPHYWSDYTGADEKEFSDKNNDNGTYLVKSMTVPWWDSNDKPVFRFRYWYLWPFPYKQSTYFLTSSQEAAKYHWYTVLRPEPDYQVTEMCVFQIVQVRY